MHSKEVSCEYIEQAVVDSRPGVASNPHIMKKDICSGTLHKILMIVD